MYWTVVVDFIALHDNIMLSLIWYIFSFPIRVICCRSSLMWTFLACTIALCGRIIGTNGGKNVWYKNLNCNDLTLYFGRTICDPCVYKIIEVAHTERCRLQYTHHVAASCSPNPCKNSGTCRSIWGSISCSCRPGFSGVYCQTRS